jgi:hypothetical protein
MNLLGIISVDFSVIDKNTDQVFCIYKVLIEIGI